MSKHPLACLRRKGICESALGNSQNPLALSSQEQCPDTLQIWSHERTSLPTAGHWTHQHWCQARVPTVTSTATSTNATLMPETQLHSYYWLSKLDVSCHPRKQIPHRAHFLMLFFSEVLFEWVGLLEPWSHVHSLAAREAGKSHFLASILGDGEKAEFIKQRCSKEAAPKYGKCPTHCYLKESSKCWEVYKK